MKILHRFLGLAFLLSLFMVLSACGKSQPTPEEAIPNPIPANSKFSKIELGWSRQRVQDTIGMPTESRDYATGKAFIPFYFGSDSARIEDLYKGQGRIIYAGGTGLTSQGFTALKIIYDPAESGYNDKPVKAAPQQDQSKKSNTGVKTGASK